MQHFSAIARVATPIGLIELSADANALTSVRIDPSDHRPCHVPAGNPLLKCAAEQINDWFAGKRQYFDLPLIALPTTRGEALRAGISSIGYGQTLTYGQLAVQIGSAPRAVGQACRRNPYPIIVPCHRVTSAGAQEFYSGGEGPRTKAWLIAFEQGKAYPYGSDRLI